MAERLRSRSSRAVQVEPVLILKRLIACRHRFYRETGTCPDKLAAALRRAEFLLHDILARLVTLAAAKERNRASPVSGKPVSIR